MLKLMYNLIHNSDYLGGENPVGGGGVAASVGRGGTGVAVTEFFTAKLYLDPEKP